MEVQNETVTGLQRLPKIVAFSKEKPYCWSVFPQLLERIGRFADAYCPDTESALLIQSLMEDFTRPKQGYFILGAMNEEYDLKGHLLACISVPPWSSKRRCLILQYQLDESLPIGLLRAAFDMIIDFAKENYCNSIIAETKTDEAKRAFQTFYGFKTDMTQVIREL